MPNAPSITQTIDHQSLSIFLPTSLRIPFAIFPRIATIAISLLATCIDSIQCPQATGKSRDERPFSSDKSILNKPGVGVDFAHASEAPSHLHRRFLRLEGEKRDNRQQRFRWCTYRESNPDRRLRRPVFYPLNYRCPKNRK